jgi:hypothetical protein
MTKLRKETLHYTTTAGRQHTYVYFRQSKRPPATPVTQKMADIARLCGISNAAEAFGVRPYDIARALKKFPNA